MAEEPDANGPSGPYVHDAFGHLLRAADAEPQPASGRREARELAADLWLLVGGSTARNNRMLVRLQGMIQGEIRRRDRRADGIGRLGHAVEAVRQRGACASLEAADLAFEEIIRGERAAHEGGGAGPGTVPADGAGSGAWPCPGSRQGGRALPRV